jgi:threonyl-tRNA synthetase
MIHRAILGSLERFIGLLIEQYAGDFPLWLAPVQARLLPITDKQHDFAVGVKDRMLKSGLRVEADLRSEKVGYKIRQAELEKVPVMLVVGGREAESGNVSVRLKGQGDQGVKSVDEVIAWMLEIVSQKSSLTDKIS